MRYIVKAYGGGTGEEFQRWLNNNAPTQEYRLIQVAGIGPVYLVIWELKEWRDCAEEEDAA